MDALKRALNPREVTDVDRTSFCSIAIPTREELQYQVGDRSEEITNEFETFFLELKEE
jgi:hypothetical protein